MLAVDPKNIITNQPKPFIKWAGGKGQLLNELTKRVPHNFRRYFEPFVGGGALFFRIQPSQAVIADKNAELVNAFIIVRDRVGELIKDLAKHKNEQEYYYALRALDPQKMSPVERASRFIYLNKTCYNGLWRVNRQGNFNVPFGRYKNPKICDIPNLQAVSAVLQGTEILCTDFEEAVQEASQGDFIYFDPPYQPLTSTAYFTNYVQEGFGENEQQRLARLMKKLSDLGCFVMLSNSDTDFIRELYKDFKVETVSANRFINCKANQRIGVTELIISNF